MNVMMAHGRRDDEGWKFLDGNKVTEVVGSYNKYAATHGLRSVELLVVCNQSIPDPSGIKIRIGEFPVNQNIAYAVGEEVSIAHGDQSRVEDGKTFLDIVTKEDMFGLDQLIDSKKLESQIKFFNNLQFTLFNLQLSQK